LLFSSCTPSKASSLKKQFKNDSSYFMALKALENNDEKTAIRLFTESASKSNPKIARLSAEYLTRLGNVIERSKAADSLVKKYGDESALLTACRIFFDQGEYTRVLSMTDDLNFESAPDQLIYYRMESLFKKNDSRLNAELFSWFTLKSFGENQAVFYEEYLKPLSENEDKEQKETQESASLPPEIQLMNYRLLIFKKNYKSAFSETNSILNIYSELNRLPHYQLLSDLGKAALYGTSDFKFSAQQFEGLAAKYSREGDNELAYCAYFYSARLYDRAGRYQEKVVQRFKSALDCTQDKSRFDNALWYLLNMQLRMSTDDIIVTLKNYAHRISNCSWFDDFFDNFSVLLLSHEKWQDFYNVWKLIDKTASEETACKYAFISGRILEEGLGETSGTPKTKEAVNAYSRVLSGNSSLYYKVCALERMNITDPTYVTDVLCSGGTETEHPADKDSQILLSGYAAWGFPQKIWQQWNEDKDKIGMDCTLQICRFLNNCGQFDNKYSVQSLRIAARTKTLWSGKIPYELLELNFPRFYSSFVEEACQENGLREELLYALIRSESFFDAKAGSTAGARGLTQLMSGTADDEAKKLKLGPDYDILDPETNIRMGSHYYAGLIERTEGKSELLALFAYNAGLTNVRRWKRPAGMSMDLFLETLPFQETREYGRKLVSAAAMYGFLYYGTTPAKTVRSLLH
jgi:soluble lytic murein transglycosylase